MTYDRKNVDFGEVDAGPGKSMASIIYPNDPGCSLIPGVGSSSPFSNSGRGVKLSVKILAGSMVLSAVGACPPHDGVR
jgi:hypothetical protein